MCDTVCNLKTSISAVSECCRFLLTVKAALQTRTMR